MSMPRSSGRCRTGVAKVPSQTVTAFGPAPRTISAIAARSVIFISGFDGVSTHTSRVFGRSAPRRSSRLVMSTYDTSSPDLPKTSPITLRSPQ